MFLGRYEGAADSFVKALKGPEPHGSPSHRFAACQIIRGTTGYLPGFPGVARFVHSVDLRGRVDVPVAVEYGLGAIFMNRMEYSVARYWFDRCVENSIDYEWSPQAWYVPAAWHNLASIAWLEGRKLEAESNLLRATEAYAVADRWYSAASCVLERAGLAEAARRAAALSEARERIQQQLQSAADDTESVADILAALAEDGAWRGDLELLLESAEGQPPAALAHLRMRLGELDLWVWFDDDERNREWTARVLEALPE